MAGTTGAYQVSNQSTHPNTQNEEKINVKDENQKQGNSM